MDRFYCTVLFSYIYFNSSDFSHNILNYGNRRILQLETSIKICDMDHNFIYSLNKRND